MPFDRLHPHLQEALQRLKFDTPMAVQELALNPVKSGKHHFIFADKGQGKTTTLILSVLQKLDCEAKEMVPRALIFVRNKEASLALAEEFKPFTRFSDLRVFTAYDQHKIRNQKDEIYEGVDILIGTPKRLNELFHQNGLNTSLLKMLIIEDAEFISERNQHLDIIRITESLSNCQFLVFAKGYHPRFEKLEETFMRRSNTLDLAKKS
jgi:superfamily II DNA/RNA helicase